MAEFMVQLSDEELLGYIYRFIKDMSQPKIHARK